MGRVPADFEVFKNNVSTSTSMFTTTRERSWTPEEAQEWKDRRNKARSLRGAPPLEDLESDDLKGYRLALQAEKRAIEKRLRNLIKDTGSWNVSLLLF